jgi:membrane protein implicated in regulation of membrane protease activity
VKFSDDLPRSPHPFRDSAIIYACLAVLIVVVATLTGGGFAKAVAIAAAFFVGATGWSWWRVRRRPQQERGE